MEVNKVVNTLNQFLQGQYMGIHAYEHHIQKLVDPYIKSEFQRIQQEHKNHSLKVAERIQNLGGTPVDDEGDLDYENRQLIEDVLDKDRQHVDFLNRLLQ